MAQPRIVQYEQQTQASIGAGMPRAQAADLGYEYVNHGAAEFGAGASNLSHALKQQEEADAQAWTAAAVSKARLDWTARMVNHQQTVKPEELGGFTPKVLAEFDDYANKSIEAAPTESAKQFVRARMIDMRADMGEKSLLFQATAQVDYRLDQYSQGVDNTKKLMNTDPAQFETALAEQMAVIDASSLPPLKKSEIKQKAVDGIASAAVWSQIQKSPSAFLTSIGFDGAGGDGKLNKTNGDLNASTGNKAFDVLPFERRAQMFEGAVKLKAQIDADADRAIDKQKKAAADEYMKEAWGRAASGKLTRSFVEQIRPVLSSEEYHSLLTGMRSEGAGSRSDPGTFRHLQGLLTTDPEVAETYAFKAHKNGLLSNEHLASALSRARELSRSEGPKSEYERTRSYVVGSLDPGPMVQDPVGRSRLAEALDTYDRWVSAEKRTDDDIRKRGQEVVAQYRFVNMSDTAMALPSPRSGSIRRNPADVQGMTQDIAAAANKAKADHEAGKISQGDYESEMAIINRWRKAVTGAQK